MTKNRIRIALSAIALIVLTGCNLPFLNKAANTVQKKAENTIQKTVEEWEGAEEGEATVEDNQGSNGSDEGSGDSGEAKTNMNECLQGCSYLDGVGMFSKEFCADSCWAAVAKDTGDMSICDTKISQDNGLVLFACYTNVAETTKSPKPCDKIGEDSSDLMRAGCIANVAKLIKDPSACDSIKGNFMYESCVSDAKGE